MSEHRLEGLFYTITNTSNMNLNNIRTEYTRTGRCTCDVNRLVRPPQLLRTCTRGNRTLLVYSRGLTISVFRGGTLNAPVFSKIKIDGGRLYTYRIGIIILRPTIISLTTVIYFCYGRGDVGQEPSGRLDLALSGESTLADRRAFS